jgi:S1-C subfamily serine protease
MTGIERANGQRPQGLLRMLHPALMGAPRPKPESLPFDLNAALDAVVGVAAEIPGDAYTAPTLGTERAGNGVLIDANGLVVTIGYLIAEATKVTLVMKDGETLPAHPIGYDHVTGFGLLRADRPRSAKPLALGSSATVQAGDPVIVAAYGGINQSIDGRVTVKREFAGSWEYLLDEAIFTTPMHPSWGGAALISQRDGKLVGVGSLYVQETVPGKRTSAGNMFVPIDLLLPIYDDLVNYGRPRREPRPWVGMYVAEHEDQLVVTGVQPNGPSDQAGMHPGDVIMGVAGKRVGASLAEFYRRIWSLGAAGTEVPLAILRGGESVRVQIRSSDRLSYMKLPRRH